MAEVAEKLNVLAVWIKRLWDTKQSPSRRFYTLALGDRPDVNLKISGPGFPDWKEGGDGCANIARIMPGCHAVLSYKALGGCESGAVVNPLSVSERYLTIEQFNECHPGTDSSLKEELHPGAGTVAEYCKRAQIGMVVVHHVSDIRRVRPVIDYGGRIVHLAHCAHPDATRLAKPWAERSGVILTGALNPDHYPLRMRWHSLIQRGKIKGAYFRRPGNYTKSRQESDNLVMHYFAALGAARVKLGCASRWGYALQHYTEAAMCGTAHVADQTDDRQYDDLHVAVHPEASDRELIDSVERAHDEFEPLGRIAQSCARQFFTTDHYAERLENEIRCLLAERGVR